MANVHVKRPIIGISMGDPFGNGPEITVSALSDASVYTRCRPLVVGDYTSLSYACRVAEKLGRTAPVLHRIESVEDAFFTPGTIDVLDLGLMPEDAIPNSLNEETPKPFGVGASKLGGEAAFQYVKTVIELAMQREIDATVTNAISKEAINMAGHHYSGHTEIYAHYTNTSKYTMMLAHDALRVVHVSTHVSLREACDRVKTPRVLDCIRIANNACKALGIETPKIAVAGLNPHCGENGMFGDEEINEIQPAIDLALAEGICIPEKAPTSPDSVFSKALAASGAKVALLGRTYANVQKLAEEITAEGGMAKAYECNVLDKTAVMACHEHVLADFGSCDILINGAGGNHPSATTDKEYYEPGDLDADTKSFFDLDETGVASVFNLNFMGILIPTQAFARDMVAREGCNIINISSMNAYTPLTKIPAYSGAKSAVSNFTQWLAVHFSKVGIRVNAIAPGFFSGKQNAALLWNPDGTPTARTKKILAATPMGRFGQAEELLGALLFLLNNEAASFVTGVVIPVDGGFSAYSGV